MKRFITYLLFLTIPMTVAAQYPDADSVSYEAMQKRMMSLTSRETAITNQLDDARRMFSVGSPEEKEQAAARIVEMEGILFQLRSEQESLSASISHYEAEYGISAADNNSKGDGSLGVADQKALLVANSYFADNLPAEDYKSLLARQAQEQDVANKLMSLKKNYDELAILIAAYNLAPKGAKADSLYSRIEVNARKNTLLAEQIENLWGDIFDTKIYTYNYILDKCSQTDILAEQERQMNNLYMLEEENEGEYMYDAAARYALQKLLITGYETRIADRAGLTAAADSLRTLTPTTSHIGDYFMPMLDTRERMFYDLSNVTFTKPPKYTSAWQMPAVEIFPRGEIYRILLGAFAKPPAIATFKGAYPMSQEKRADGKYYYYAGGFATYEEAAGAANKLKAQGFSNPRVVGWQNGTYEEPDGQSTKPVTAGQIKNNGTKYRVEIYGAGEGLSSVVREAINNGAAGKEISRIPDPDSGETIFIIGAFSNKTLADSLVSDIIAVAPGMSLKVVQIQ